MDKPAGSAARNARARSVTRCKKCRADLLRLRGKPASYGRELDERMLELALCRQCLYWEEQARAADGLRRVVCDGVLHVIGPEGVREWWRRGFEGRRFLVKLHDSSETIATRNLWRGGKVPARERGRFPDDADIRWDNRPSSAALRGGEVNQENAGRDACATQQRPEAAATIEEVRDGTEKAAA